MGILQRYRSETTEEATIEDCPSTREVRERLEQAETDMNELRRFAKERQALRQALMYYSSRPDGSYARIILQQWPDH